MMKILFDLTCLQPPRSGVAYYAQALIEALANEPQISEVAGWFRDKQYAGVLIQQLIRDDQTQSKPKDVSPSLLRRIKDTSALQPLLLPLYRALLRRRSSDLRRDHARRGYIYHEPNFLAAPYRGPTVVTIHDLSHVRHPEYHNPATVINLNQALPSTLRRADAIIVDSHYTKRELVALYHVPEQRISTIHLGVDAAFHPMAEERCETLLGRLGIHYQGYVLSVCTLQPRKNLVRLVQAFSELPEDIRKVFPLVLTGTHGWKNSELLDVINVLSNRGQIILPGYLRRDDLTTLYAGAAVFAYPSLYEGFGLPVAEAMASGVPVLTSNTTSIPEVTGGAAVEVDPLSVEDLKNGLARLLGEQALRADLRARGLRRAAELTWKKTAEETSVVYRAVSR